MCFARNAPRTAAFFGLRRIVARADCGGICARLLFGLDRGLVTEARLAGVRLAGLRQTSSRVDWARPFPGQVFRADISGYAARKWVLVHMYMAGATNSNRQTQWEPLLTPIDAADYLRLHPKTVIRMARQRQVPAIRLGKH